MQNGRIVVITGAGGGIGGKIVDRFLVNGDTVVGLDRSEPSLKALEAGCAAAKRLTTVTADITDPSEVTAFAAQMQVGIPVATRTTAPPKLDAEQQRQFMEKAKALAPKYRTELLKEA